MNASSMVLTHVCCGPCAIMPLIRLQEAGYEPIAWFYNPNIQPLMEYMRRREGAAQCAAKLDVPIIFDDDCDPGAWLTRQLPLRSSHMRCERCCETRLENARNKAVELGCQFFTTTLLYSRYQPHVVLKRKGEELSRTGSAQFLYQDFRNDWQAGIDLSRAWGIYRQPYCGCIFSEYERYANKFQKLQKGAAHV